MAWHAATAQSLEAYFRETRKPALETSAEGEKREQGSVNSDWQARSKSARNIGVTSIERCLLRVEC